MKLFVRAKCQEGEEAKKFDQLECQDCFTDYIDDDFPKCISGGYMHFTWSDMLKALYVVTEYETTRKLTAEEEKIVIDYTQGQWSDGIGEGFEQQEFSEGVYNPSPWFFGQQAHIYYE